MMLSVHGYFSPFRRFSTLAVSLAFASTIGLSSAEANEAVELCSGGALRTVESGQSVERDIQPGDDLRYILTQPVGAGRVDYGLHNDPASAMEINFPSRKLGVLLIMCRTADLQSWSDTEVLRVVELQPGLRSNEFIPIVNNVPVQEGDRFVLRVVAIPPTEEERSRLRRVVGRAATAAAIVTFGGPAALPALAAAATADLMRSSASDNSNLPFGLRFSLTASALSQPQPEPQPETAEDPASESDTADAASSTPLEDLLEEQFSPVIQPELPDLLFPEGAQADGDGYFTAPATAPVGSLIPVQITYEDRHNADNLILIDPESPDDALTGPSGRNVHRIRDNDTVYRRAADRPGIYEVRLRRHAGWDRRVLARSQIELVDINIDIQVPEQVGTREEFDVYMNPVMDGHLVIVPADRDPENLVGENTRRSNVVEDAEGPGLFARTAPRSAGDYEVRFHFNQQQPRWAEHTHRAGRLMARVPLRVVDASELEDMTAEGEAEAQDDQLAALEAKIAELSENIEAATVAQADEIHDLVAALGLPALAMLIDLLNRDQISPQLVQVFTAPQSPAQWASAPTPPAAPAPAPASAPATPAAAAPTAPVSQPEITAAQPQTQAPPTTYAVTGVAADDMLNVRSGPGVQNMITGMLPPSATGIRPTGQSAQSADGGTWWQIADPALPGGTGWVNARFLAPAQTASPAQAAPEQPAEAHSPQGLDPAQYHQVTGVASNAVLYLRSSPTPDAPIVGMLPPDATEISITGAQQASQNGRMWVQVYHANAPDGGMAWVEAAYLEQMDPLPSIAQVAQDFTHAPGMNDFDTHKLEQSIANILHYAADSALAPGHGLSPLTKSIVAVQAIDGRLPHARYHLTYRQGEATLSADGSFDTVDLVELRRFNLGPARHAATVAAHGAENTAELAHFGEGPDVVWRLAMRPLRGNDAVILSAARAEIDTPERDCMGFHCQMAQSIVPHMADWGDESSIAMPEFRPSYDELWQGAPSAPAVLDALALTSFMAEAAGGDARWNSIEPRMMDDPLTPFIEVIIEVGMGQDTGAEVGFYETRLRDDELMSIWYRLGAFGGPGQHHVIRASAAERWPHRQ